MHLGIDLGTTNVKAVVLTSDGSVVSDGSAPVAIEHLSDGGVEQDIEQIWEATLAAISAAVTTRIGPEIQAIGISSQGGAIQPLDREGGVLGRVISWQDARGRPYDDRITNEMGSEWFAEHAGHSRSGVAVGQVLRLQQEYGEFYADVGKIAFVGDVVVSRLCGRHAHDATSLAIASLYNPWLDRTEPDLLARLGLDDSMLPDLLLPCDVAGPLRPQVAAETSLLPGIPVSPAVHDQYAASVGVGAVRPGDVMFGAGTAWVLLAMTDALTGPVIGEAYVCRHVVEGLYGQLLSMVNGGSCLKWALDLLGLGDENRSTVDALLGAVASGCDGLRCHPLLNRSGGARLGPEAAGRLGGLRLSHTSAHVVRSVLEGLVMELTRYLGFFRESGLTPKRLIMCGGAADSHVTPQMVADVTGLDVLCQSRSGASAVGAAIIARSLTEADADLGALAGDMSPPARVVHPGPESERYHLLLAEYIGSLAS